MNKCYYLEINYKPRIKHGVWANMADAEAKAAELNQRFKKEWDDYCRKKREEVVRLQKRWDALKVAGLSEGERPVLWGAYNAEWEPGICGTEYYTVGVAKFFKTNKKA